MVPDLLMLQTRIKNRPIRRGIVALALLAVLLGIPVAAAQTFDEAVGAVIRRDYATAIRGFRVHAEQGHAEAQLILGGMYADGRGVLKDEAEAVRWFRLAADQGNARMQFILGVKYANGRGVLKDEAEAVRWYRLAAEQGHADAQFNLGGMYANGRGVLKDEAEAVRWYRLATEQGYATALSNPGACAMPGLRVTAPLGCGSDSWYGRKLPFGASAANMNDNILYHALTTRPRAALRQAIMPDRSLTYSRAGASPMPSQPAWFAS